MVAPLAPSNGCQVPENYRVQPVKILLEHLVVKKLSPSRSIIDYACNVAPSALLLEAQQCFSVPMS
jgi:hypothetical protein